MPMPISFKPTEIDAVWEVNAGVFEDDRGFFMEAYNAATWTEAGFTEPFLQDNVSTSKRGTLRGLHYQLEPHGMGKLVRAMKGSIFDVAVDIRQGSPTFGKWVGRTLSAENKLALWVPSGFAHGFIALEDDSMVWYKCTSTHAPESERSIRYNDPAIGIDWGIEPEVISDKDAVAPLLAEAEYNFAYTGG